MEAILVLSIIFVLFFSIILHEVSHGYAALRNGDDTARLMGRLTLNPLPHIDPIGTILLPIMLYITTSGRFLFGWAKPVPINPSRFYDFRRGMLEVGLSGPLANFTLAAFFSLVYRFGGVAGTAAGALCIYGVFINILLAVFNLIPIPPLDGSRVLGSFLSAESQVRYFRLERYGMFIVFGLIFLFFPLLLALVRALAVLATGADTVL